MSPDDAPGASLLGLPRPVLASVLGRLPPADLARFQVACVGADDLEPGHLVEDASFEAVSAFAAQRSLYWHAYSIRIYCIRARAPFTGLNEAFFK